MKRRTGFFVGILVGLMLSAPTVAADKPAEPQAVTLFTNTNIYDGKNDKLATGMSVLVEGNKIAKIAKKVPVRQGYAGLQFPAVRCGLGRWRPV